jgi:hypothetical protein
MTGPVIPVGVSLSPRNIYLRNPVFSITQTASRLMRTTFVADCISAIQTRAGRQATHSEVPQGTIEVVMNSPSSSTRT